MNNWNQKTNSGSTSNSITNSTGVFLNTGTVSGSVINQGTSDEARSEVNHLAVKLDDILQTASSDKGLTEFQVLEKALNAVKSDRELSIRLKLALKAGMSAALAQALSHPLASFFIAAIEHWNSK